MASADVGDASVAGEWDASVGDGICPRLQAPLERQSLRRASRAQRSGVCGEAGLGGGCATAGAELQRIWSSATTN